MMLLGNVSQKELYRKYPVFLDKVTSYRPDAATLDRIRQVDVELSIVMFLGTWCGDSVREVPRLLKILESAKNPRLTLTLYGVDSSLNDGGGMAKQYGIERVPTMIFLLGEKELGRIVEPPDGTLERDLLKVLEAARQ